MLKKFCLFLINMAPPPKLVWTPSASASTSSKAKPRKSILTELEETRAATAPDITKFDFNKKRIQKLGGSESSAESGQAVGNVQFYIHEKIRETIFTFKPHCTKLHSF